MNRCLLLLLLSVLPGAAFAQSPADSELETESRITRLGLFKNGYAVVTREVAIPQSGSYLVLDVPAPVHGTLWLESEAVIEARVTQREVERMGRRRIGADLQESLSGREVTLTLHGDVPALTGRVVKFLGDLPDRDAAAQHWQNPRQAPQPWAPPATDQRFLVLMTDTGHRFIDRGQIRMIEIDELEESSTEERPVLILQASEVPKGGATLRISYLTRGISWAPNYRFDLRSDGRMKLEQYATIRNELVDLIDVEIELISGFPSIEFARVLSPLSPHTDWASFFGQLHGGGQRNAAIMSNVMSQSISYGAAGPGGAATVVPDGEGVDTHYESVGKRSLALGDSVVLTVEQGEAPYERIVEWVVPDTRDVHGRRIEANRGWGAPPLASDAPWDAVRFDNPLSFPMTTGPAMVTSDGRFRGQQQSAWVNVGERTTLPVNRALSVRTLSTEVEKADERNHLRIGGHNYREVSVRGELLICNHRGEPVTMVVRRQFSGEKTAASDAPVERKREEGVYSVNPRNELEWTVILQPGEQKTLTYEYKVLVLH